MKNHFPRWTWNDTWLLAVTLFVLYLFVSCCANDIADAYQKAHMISKSE